MAGDHVDADDRHQPQLLLPRSDPASDRRPPGLKRRSPSLAADLVLELGRRSDRWRSASVATDLVLELGPS